MPRSLPTDSGRKILEGSSYVRIFFFMTATAADAISHFHEKCLQQTNMDSWNPPWHFGKALQGIQEHKVHAMRANMPGKGKSFTSQ